MYSPNELRRLELAEADQPEEALPEVDQQLVDKANTGDVYLSQKIAEVLGHDIKDVDKFEMELKALIDYTKDKGATSIEDALWEIRYLANRLGTPGYGEDRIKFMYQYITLLKHTFESERKLKKMESLNA